MSAFPIDPATFVRRRMVSNIRAIFNDGRKGETPVAMSDDALFPRGSVIWRVHGDVTTMMVCGIGALLMQMLHPLALAGVWDHSQFRDDMIGRLRRTARFIAITTYGERGSAEAAIARVRQVHTHIAGARPDGTRYAASDPRLLAWVHVCEATCFLEAWIRYGEPNMSRADQDRYFAESAVVAEMLGADPVPRTRAEANALLRDMRQELHVDARTSEVARLILNPPEADARTGLALNVISDAAIALIPAWAQAMHGLKPSALKAPLVHLGAFGMASAVRWAFAGDYRKGAQT